ncbi:MAG: VWA domain-containing protein [Blastocatellia bacterium]
MSANLLCRVLLWAGFLSLAGVAGAQETSLLPNARSRHATADADIKIRVQTDVVSLNVNVLDQQGRPVTGLEPQHFEVYEDGIRQTIEYFRTTDAPASVGVIFDISGSMQHRLAEARAAFQSFVEASHPEDDFFLISVSDKPQLLMDVASGDELVRQISSLRAAGHTALQDAIAMGLEKLEQARHPKRALLVISDGVDNHSRVDARQLMRRVKESEPQIYTIGTADFSGINCGPICRLGAQQLLEGVAQQSGGAAFFLASQKQLEDATYRIALLLRQQYSFGYLPTNEARQGKWRKVEVKVKDNGQKTIIRTRRGYYDTQKADASVTP